MHISDYALAPVIADSLPLLAFDVLYPGLHELLNERGGHRLVYGEVNGAFGRRVAPEFILKCFDNRGSGKQTAVVREGSKPHQDFILPERRNPVTDGLDSFRWHYRPNRCANLV